MSTWKEAQEAAPFSRPPVTPMSGLENPSVLRRVNRPLLARTALQGSRHTARLPLLSRSLDGNRHSEGKKNHFFPRPSCA